MTPLDDDIEYVKYSMGGSCSLLHFTSSPGGFMEMVVVVKINWRIKFHNSSSSNAFLFIIAFTSFFASIMQQGNVCRPSKQFHLQALATGLLSYGMDAVSCAFRQIGGKNQRKGIFQDFPLMVL